VAHDVAVLEGAGLAFIGVAHQVFIALILLGHETPLQSGRKSGAATAAQGRFFYFLYNFFRWNLFLENFS
jgi:hypothetical protein